MDPFARQALLPTELLLFEEKSDAGGGALEYALFIPAPSVRPYDLKDKRSFLIPPTTLCLPVTKQLCC
jgi:hypothetical protein